VAKRIKVAIGDTVEWQQYSFEAREFHGPVETGVVVNIHPNSAKPYTVSREPLLPIYLTIKSILKVLKKGDTNV
jgi:hypothetical protein